MDNYKIGFLTLKMNSDCENHFTWKMNEVFGVVSRQKLPWKRKPKEYVSFLNYMKYET